MQSDTRVSVQRGILLLIPPVFLVAALCGCPVCNGPDTALEPNDAILTAVPVGPGEQKELKILGEDEDWYRVTVPPATLVVVRIDFPTLLGDLDLVVYDEDGNLVGSRYGAAYPYPFWDPALPEHQRMVPYQTRLMLETSVECYALYSESREATYYLRVNGYAGDQNVYSLSVRHVPYMDGPACEPDFAFGDCAGMGEDGAGLLPFPFPDPYDSVVGAGYTLINPSNYRFARREVIMAFRHALSLTQQQFPGTTPVDIGDLSQINGETPGVDTGILRHPANCHDEGASIDIAYFQSDGANDFCVVCGDGSTIVDDYCTEQAAQTHFVDLPRQAFFMAKLFANPRVRVIGVDEILAPLLLDAAGELYDAGVISEEEMEAFFTRMRYGENWPNHHHHIHVNFHWWVDGPDDCPNPSWMFWKD